MSSYAPLLSTLAGAGLGATFGPQIPGMSSALQGLPHDTGTPAGVQEGYDAIQGQLRAAPEDLDAAMLQRQNTNMVAGRDALHGVHPTADIASLGVSLDPAGLGARELSTRVHDWQLAHAAPGGISLPGTDASMSDATAGRLAGGALGGAVGYGAGQMARKGLGGVGAADVLRAKQAGFRF
jgi:hypothetical protein